MVYQGAELSGGIRIVERPPPQDRQVTLGLNHVSHEEQHEMYKLLDLRVGLAIEDGMKVAYADCVLDTGRLTVNQDRSTVNTMSLCGTSFGLTDSC
jgi:hypothetical protein